MKTALLIIAATITLAFSGCSTLRTITGKPAEATARDHRADGGKATLDLKGIGKVSVDGADNPAQGSTIRYRSTRWIVIPPPAPTQPPPVLEAMPPTTSTGINALPFATIQPPNLLGFLGFGKKEKDEPPPPAPVPQPPTLPPGAVVLPDGSIAIPDTTDIEAGMGPSQNQAEMVSFLGLEQRGKDLATVAFLAGGIGIAAWLQGWRIIGFILLIGAFATWQTNSPVWAYVSAVAAILLFLVVELMESKFAAAVARANPVAGAIMDGVADAVKRKEEPTP